MDKTLNEQTIYRPILSRPAGKQLRAELLQISRGSGLLDPITFQSSVILGIYGVCFGLVLWQLWFSEHTVILIIDYCLMSFIISQSGFLAHDALHASISRRKLVNDTFGQLGMTIIGGMGFREWKTRHILHHRYCQLEDRDPDMAVGFVASITRQSYLSKKGISAFFGRYQHYYVWILILLFAHSHRHVSQACVLKDLNRYYIDLIFLIGHYFIWWILPIVFLDVSVLAITMAYFIPGALLGVHFAAVFWVNHVGMPLVTNKDTLTFVEHQVATSRNVRVPKAWDLFFGGLNFQIEHHVLPSCPSIRLRELNKLFRPRIEQVGLPYREMSWPDAFKEVRRHISAVVKLPSSTANEHPEAPSSNSHESNSSCVSSSDDRAASA